MERTLVGFMVSVAKGGLLVRHAVENHPGGARERDASVGLGWGMGVDFESCSWMLDYL